MEDFEIFFEQIKYTLSSRLVRCELENFLNFESVIKLTKLFSEKAAINTVNKIENSDQQYLIKLLAFVIIKKLAEEAIEDFVEEQDAQNKLDILSESIHQIQEIQKVLVLCLPDVKSSICTDLDLPAADFAHFQNNNNQRIGHILDRLASKAFQLASEFSEHLITSKAIEDQIFSPIFDISKALKIGKEETRLYLDNIEKKIKDIKKSERVSNNGTEQNIQSMFISEDTAIKYLKAAPKGTPNKIIVLNESYVSYLMVKISGKFKKFYLRNEQQCKAFQELIKFSKIPIEAQNTVSNGISRKTSDGVLSNIPTSTRAQGLPSLASPNRQRLKGQLLYKQSLDSPFLIEATKYPRVIACFESLVATHLKHPESQCTIAYNEISGFRRHYKSIQELCIKEIKTCLEEQKQKMATFAKDKDNKDFVKFLNNDYSQFNNLPTIGSDEAEEDFNSRLCLYINEEIIPRIKLLSKLTKNKYFNSAGFLLFKMHIKQLLDNYRGYKSVAHLARNYESIIKFEQTTLLDCKEKDINKYKNHINDILKAIRPNQKEFGYHKGLIIYLTNEKGLKPEYVKKTPTIIYDCQQRQIKHLIINDGKKNVVIKIPHNCNTNTLEVFARATLLKSQTPPNLFLSSEHFVSSQVFIGYKDKLAEIIMSIIPNEYHAAMWTYAPTIVEQSLQSDLKHANVGTVRKISFNEQGIVQLAKFLIIKGHDGEINIVHHYGGNRLYRPQDILPHNKDMPTALFLLGIGHFGDVKAGFLPSGEQKVIKVVRLGSTNITVNRKSHKDVWDEREDDLQRELIGLNHNRKLITHGNTSSYLRKLTKEKKEWLLVTEQPLYLHDASHEKPSMSKTTIVKQQKEQPSLSFMDGKATHILMELSGSKDLRKEINEIVLEVIPTDPERFKNYFRYFIDRAIGCCSIMEEQHKIGTHNDFKPANIVITRDGNLEIIDFGTYQHNGKYGADDKKLNPIVHGTPVFMNPNSLQEIEKHLAITPIRINQLFNEPAVPDNQSSSSTFKKYYIRKRLYDIFSSQNIIIKNIESIKLLITKIILYADSDTLMNLRTLAKQGNHSKTCEGKRNTYNTKKAEITEKTLKIVHQSKIQHTFRRVDGSNVKIAIQWTIKDEIDLALKTIEAHLKNNLVSSRVSMGCDKSYDMYSLVSMLSGSANKSAYITNVIFRYGALNDKDLLNIMKDDEQELICPIQDYLKEGQGLQLDRLFEEITISQELKQTAEQKEEFINLYKQWQELRDQILLQKKHYEQLNPEKFKEILQKIKENVLGIQVTTKNNESVDILKRKKLPTSIDELKLVLNTHNVETKEKGRQLEGYLSLNLQEDNIYCNKIIYTWVTNIVQSNYDYDIVFGGNPKLLQLFLNNQSQQNPKQFDFLFNKADGTQHSLLEVILKSQHKSMFNALKKYLKDQSKKTPDRITFITDLCSFNYPNNFAKLILKNLQVDENYKPVLLVNFYRLLTNIVFPTDDPENFKEIAKNRKIAAGILLASMPKDYIVSDLCISFNVTQETQSDRTSSDDTLILKHIISNINKYDILTIQLIRNGINNNENNIFDTILSVENIEAFQEDLIDIAPGLWDKKINAKSFFSEPKYESNVRALLKYDKIGLFKKLFINLCDDDKLCLEQDLAWMITFAERNTNDSQIVKYLKNNNIKTIPNILLDKQAILEFLIKKIIAQKISTLPELKAIKTSLGRQTKRASTINNQHQSDVPIYSCARLRQLLQENTLSEFYNLIDEQNHPLKSEISQFFLKNQGDNFDLGCYTNETLMILIEAIKTEKDIFSKKSLIGQVVVDLHDAKKLKAFENELTEPLAQEKEKKEILMSYESSCSKSTATNNNVNIAPKDKLRAAFQSLLLAQRNYDELLLLNDSQGVQKLDRKLIQESFGALIKCQRNYDSLLL